MRIVSLLFCLFIAVAGQAQRIENPFCQKPDFENFISSVEKNKKNEIATLKSLFNRAHRKFLKNYSAYAQVNDIFEKGNFDCLSGTYFLAASLQHLGYTFKIIETNYHIFMIVETGQGRVLFESTDRHHGFVTSETEITERLKDYQLLEKAQNKKLYLSSFHLFHEVLTNQLPGLLFYNQAIDSFHKKDWKAAYTYLEKAWSIYENPRIDEFTPILIRSILSSKMEENEKIKMVSVLQEHQRINFTQVLASM